jgi:carboxylesterase
VGIMLESWPTILVLGFLFALVLANLLIFLFACYEYLTSSRKEPWLWSTQVLPSRAGDARASVILLHGFGGSPYDLRGLAELLAARGFRAVVPALPGQTSTSFAYRRGQVSPAVYSDWLLNLIKEEAALSGGPPMLVGFSMGGALAAIAAADYPVGKLVLISPYFQLAVGGKWVSASPRWLRWIIPVVPKLAKGQISDPEGYRAYATGTYLVSLEAFLQLTELAEIAKRKAQGLALPMLVVAPRGDTVASFSITESLFQGRDQVQMIACDRGNHIVAFDFERERVMKEIVAFLAAETTPQDGH